MTRSRTRGMAGQWVLGSPSTTVTFSGDPAGQKPARLPLGSGVVLIFLVTLCSDSPLTFCVSPLLDGLERVTVKFIAQTGSERGEMNSSVRTVDINPSCSGQIGTLRHSNEPHHRPS